MKLPSHTKTKQPSGSRAPFYWQGQFCKWPALLSKDHDRFTDSWLSIPRVLRQQPIEGCTHDHNKVCVHVMYKSRQRSKHVRRCDDCNKSRPFKPSVEYMNIYILYIYLFIILKTFTLPEHDDDQGCASGHPPKRLPPGIVIILVVCCFFLHLKDAPARRSQSLDGSMGNQFTNEMPRWIYRSGRIPWTRIAGRLLKLVSWEQEHVRIQVTCFQYGRKILRYLLYFGDSAIDTPRLEKNILAT